jgi:Ca2+:H+ antiporter
MKDIGINLDELRSTTPPWNGQHPTEEVQYRETDGLAALEIEIEDDTDKSQKKKPKAVHNLDLAYVKRTFNHLMLGSSLNVLLIFVIPALLGDKMYPDSKKGDFTEGITFVLSLLALIPLAERLGFVTEQLALHTTQTLGGLLNATFGNLTEVIVCVVALQKDMYRIVQLSMLGSVLSNLLLVLGCALWVGGLKHKRQTYNKTAALMNCAMLTLGLMAFLLCQTLAEAGYHKEQEKEVLLSRLCSVALTIMYGAYLYFQVSAPSSCQARVSCCLGNH